MHTTGELMTTIMFCKKSSPSREKFLKLLEMNPTLQNIVLCEDFQHLSHAIKTMISIHTVALLIIDTSEDLKKLLKYSESLNQMRLLIVIGQGMDLNELREHKLYPRYVTRQNCNWDEINEVLIHIVSKIHIQETYIENQQRQYERTETDSYSR